MILIVADDQSQCVHIETQLIKASYQTYSTSQCVNALDILSKIDIELVILDVMSPSFDGLQTAQKVCTQFFTPILMLSVEGDDGLRTECFEAGADQCLQKPFCNIELLSRVKSILRRVDLEKVRYRQFQGTQTLERKISSLPFTRTESRLINYLISHKNKAISKKELQTSVLRSEFSLLDRNVDMHFSNIRRKLTQFGLSKNVILTVRNKGYIYEGKEEQ